MKLLIAASALMALAFGQPASGQNRDLRPLSPPETVVRHSPDDFSAVDVADVSLGTYQTYYYAGLQAKLRLLRHKETGEAQFVVFVLAPRLRTPGEIYSVQARGGTTFRKLSETAGHSSCNRYSCRQDVAASFEVPAQILEQVRAGSSIEFRISASCGPECDVVLPIPATALAALDRWEASHPAPTTPSRPGA